MSHSSRDDRIRVLYLALQAPDLSPSQRFRVEAFLPYLRDHGVDVEYSWILDAGEVRDFYGRKGVGAKARVAVRALFRRLASLVPRPWCSPFDVVLVQREAHFLFGAWSERIAAKRAPVIFDFDDAIWIPAVSEGNRRFSFLKNVKKVPEVIALAHTVVAGNDHLADYARTLNSNVHMVPTCVDTERYRPVPRRSGEPVVIGWSGSASTVAHLRLIIPVLRRLREKYGERIRFKIVGDPGFAVEDLGIRGEAWSVDTEVQSLQAMDVGLMPLPDDAWALGKCGFKALTYMAVGVPALISPVGVNVKIVQDGRNGFTPANDEEWVARISELIEDAELRRRIGDAGRKTVEEGYSLHRWSDTILGLIREAANRRN